MNQRISSITRPIDDGQPLFLPDPPGAPSFDGFAVDTAVCDNPRCPCSRMPLFARAVRFDDKGAGRFPGSEITGEVSSDGSGLKLDSAPASTLSDELVAWLHDRIGESEHQRWLAERWRRMRGQIGDPAYPSPVVPSPTDMLVPFSQVFPWDFDLTVVHDQRKYLAIDQYCLQPRCTCDDLNVQFFDLMTDADSAPNLGLAKATLRSLQSATFQGQPIVRELWNALLAQTPDQVLRDRFNRMRQVADRQLRAPGTPARKAPCPCGSGKKYKRCCGK